MTRSIRDIIIVAALTIISLYLCLLVGFFEILTEWIRSVEYWQVGDTFVPIVVLAIGLAWLAFRRIRELRIAYANRTQAEETLRAAHDELGARVAERTASLTEAKAQLEAEIAERKRVEHTLRFQGQIVENMAEGVQLTRTSDGLIVYANPTFERLFGYDSEELVGKHVTVLNAPSDRSPEETAHEIIQGVKETGMWRGEIYNIKKDGTLFWCHAIVSTFDHAEYGEVWVTAQEDITERKRAEEQIKAALREKEVLLKEIHHRVKNNLQVIYSLLSLQSRKVQKKNPELFFDCMECQHRIQAMALVHERLYQSQDLTTVNFAEYAQSFTGELVRFYGVNPEVITLKFGVEDAALDIDTAIPCGLILHELVSNALQHAFPAGRAGTIDIQFRSAPEGYQLRVSDDGVGLPKGLVLQEADTVGLTLVNALVSQLAGTVEVEEGVGTAFKISFPVMRE